MHKPDSPATLIGFSLTLLLETQQEFFRGVFFADQVNLPPDRRKISGRQIIQLLQQRLALHGPGLGNLPDMGQEQAP